MLLTYLPIGFTPEVMASKVTIFPTSKVTLEAGIFTNCGLPSLNTLEFKTCIISLPDPRLILLELRIRGVTEYSVCSRSFSEAVEDELLKSIDEATESLSESSETWSTSLSPIRALISETHREKKSNESSKLLKIKLVELENILKTDR